MYRIREIELDSAGKVLAEVIVERQFVRLDDARHEVTLILSSADHAGYEPEHGHWWTHNKDGKRFRYVIEVAD